MLGGERLHAIDGEHHLERHGFSDQSVPSLSKVAMRSGGGTKSGPPSRVTRATKSTIDFLAAPSFHDGSG